MYYDKNTVTPHEKIASELFLSGYNCAQSVFAAFSDVMGLDFEAAVKLSSAFGGGMCGRRDTCGSVSGMLMALSQLCGYTDTSDANAKKELYAVGLSLTREFEEHLGSTVCRELLAGMKLSSTPSVRTEEYYKVRPCVKFCAVAANILDGYLASRERDGETEN